MWVGSDVGGWVGSDVGGWVGSDVSGWWSEMSGWCGAWYIVFGWRHDMWRRAYTYNGTICRAALVCPDDVWPPTGLTHCRCSGKEVMAMVLLPSSGCSV